MAWGRSRRSWEARSVASAGIGTCDGSYASLGDTHVELACIEINTMMKKVAHAMVSYSPSREAVLPMLFTDDTLIKLQAVRGMVKIGRAHV